MLNDTRLPRRFWDRVQPTLEGCWIWLGKLTSDGYGVFERTTAHRYAYQRLVGEFARQLSCDHLCFERSCVNPEHVDPVTQGENVRRSLHRRKKKAACPQGHANVPANKDRWGCAICRRAASSRRKRRLRSDPAYRERERKENRERMRRSRGGVVSP